MIDRRHVAIVSELAESAHLDEIRERHIAFGARKILDGNGHAFRRSGLGVSGNGSQHKRRN
ncbi:hypothetical protein [Paraburkholderia oxyphila]|uniref:hypothetical protein n=1 Tax=Paraburkholderia oxyphila TaxID=614212 RepID=UPI002ADE44A0|nr:hypothetical protein [Paraburkholderia oxyphila]